MPTESGLRSLTRSLEVQAQLLANELNRTSSRASYQKVVSAYNALCVVLNYLNEELKTEPIIDGIAGPIPITWQQIAPSA